MNIKRLSRIVICLVLVCSLLFNFVFVRANASVTLGVVAVSSAVVVGAALIGLGIIPVPENLKAYSNAVDAVVTDLGLGAFIDAVSFVSGGYTKTAVPVSLVNDIRESIVKNSVAYVKYFNGSEKNCTAPAGTTFQYINGTVTATSDCYAFFVKGTSSTSRHVILAGVGAYPTFTYTVENTKRIESYIYGGYYFKYIDFADSYASSHTGFVAYNPATYTDWKGVCRAFVDGQLSISPSLEMVAAPEMVTGILFPPTVPFESSYTMWANSIISVPGSSVGTDTEEEIPYVPIGIGSTYEETITQTQEEVQSATGSIADSEAGTGAISQSWLGQKIDAIVSWLSDVKTAIVSIPTAFATWFSDVITGIRSLGDTITNAWNTAIEAILTGIQSIFVPSEDFLTAKVEALRTNFSFADSIITSGEYIGNSLQGLGTEPPVIYINLANNRGPYDLGGEVAFLDLRWYAEYKPVGDAIISAFLWIVFAWRMLIKAPGIISGMPGDFVMNGVEGMGLADRLPGRSKEYEQTRRENRRINK